MGQGETDPPHTTKVDRATRPPTQGQGAGRTVLVVEDEPGISEALRFILQRDGWVVKILERGDAVIDAMTAQPPDLVILDVNLPGLNGLEVLRILRGTADLETLPVILLTARGQNAARAMAMEYGASEFISKPFANAEVLDAVRRLAIP